MNSGNEKNEEKVTFERYFCVNAATGIESKRFTFCNFFTLTTRRGAVLKSGSTEKPVWLTYWVGNNPIKMPQTEKKQTKLTAPEWIFSNTFEGLITSEQDGFRQK